MYPILKQYVCTRIEWIAIDYMDYKIIMMNGCEICRPFHDSINFVLSLRALANNCQDCCVVKKSMFTILVFNSLTID